uniref:T-box domain-containing protein n=1 Tax=Steinernema glaseri TaxID=37863 RepID=A0A1I7YNN5_9BILA
MSYVFQVWMWVAMELVSSSPWPRMDSAGEYQQLQEDRKPFSSTPPSQYNHEGSEILDISTLSMQHQMYAPAYQHPNPFYPYNQVSFMAPQSYSMTPQTPQNYPSCPLPGSGTTVFSSPESLNSSMEVKSTPYPCPVAAPQENTDITVELVDKELWKQFYEVGNEMVLTKSGRNPFPKFHIKIRGLNPNSYYKVAVSFDRSDDKRYKFNEGKMESAGTGEPMQPSDRIFHPDGTLQGHVWMQGAIKFDKLKISNTLNEPSKPCVRLFSMHKYHALLHVYSIDNYDSRAIPHMLNDNHVASIPIPYTTFVTVTAYQNQNLIALKVKHNNYARGFRADGKHTKRKSQELSERRSLRCASSTDRSEATTRKRLNDSTDSGVSVTSPPAAQWINPMQMQQMQQMQQMPQMPYSPSSFIYSTGIGHPYPVWHVNQYNPAGDTPL